MGAQRRHYNNFNTEASLNRYFRDEALNEAVPIFIRTTARRNHAIPRRFLLQRNAKNSKSRGYDVSSLRSFAASSFLVAALPLWGIRGAIPLVTAGLVLEVVLREGRVYPPAPQKENFPLASPAAPS